MLLRSGGFVLANVSLDELQQYGGHIDALGRGCGLKSVVEINLDVDVHSLYTLSFLVLDRYYPLPLEMNEIISARGTGTDRFS